MALMRRAEGERPCEPVSRDASVAVRHSLGGDCIENPRWRRPQDNDAHARVISGDCLHGLARFGSVVQRGAQNCWHQYYGANAGRIRGWCPTGPGFAPYLPKNRPISRNSRRHRAAIAGGQRARLLRRWSAAFRRGSDNKPRLANRPSRSPVQKEAPLTQISLEPQAQSYNWLGD